MRPPPFCHSGPAGCGQASGCARDIWFDLVCEPRYILPLKVLLSATGPRVLRLWLRVQG